MLKDSRLSDGFHYHADLSGCEAAALGCVADGGEVVVETGIAVHPFTKLAPCCLWCDVGAVELRKFCAAIFFDAEVFHGAKLRII